jgi:DNA polymerase-4
VTVKIKYADFRQVTRSRTLPAMITSQETLRNVSIDLVRTVFPPAKGIRLLGVTLSSFENAERSASKQLDLGLVGRVRACFRQSGMTGGGVSRIVYRVWL